MTVLLWLTAIAALVGVVLNIRKHVACFWIWSMTNAVWVYADMVHGIYSQAALQAAYLGLAVYGIYAWTRNPDKQEVR